MKSYSTSYLFIYTIYESMIKSSSSVLSQNLFQQYFLDFLRNI